MAPRSEPLEGLVVVDLSTTVASALTTLLFADYGAEVISVERPGGSRLREQAAWPYWLRGKRSIVLDLEEAADQEVAQGLAAGADVVVEAWGPGTADRLGVGDEALRAANPGLVYTAISGFGHTGPYSHLKAFEAVVMAKTGSMYGNTAPHRPGPVMINPWGAMASAALLAMQGTLLALHDRTGSGFGQRVDATMAQGMMAQDPWFYFLLELAQKFPDALRASPGPTMAGKRAVPPSWLSFGLLNGVSQEGRWMQFSHATPIQFDAFLSVLGLGAEWKAKADDDDPAVRDELWTEMLARVRSRNLAEWQAIFDRDKHVFAEQYRRGTELFAHPQIVHDGHAVEYEQPGMGSVTAMGRLVKLLDDPGAQAWSVTSPAPAADADGASLRAHPPSPKPVPSGNPPDPHPPLEGITVVDLGTFYAGPFGSAMFADQGARVIKIEQLDGDPIRFNMPMPESAGVRVTQGKQSIAVDVNTPTGHHIVSEIIRGADIVLHTYRGGVAQRMGLDADSMRRINPELIYHHGVGYGIDGPYTRRSAFAPTIAAGSGFAARSGGTGGTPVADDASIDDIKDLGSTLAGTPSGHPDGMAALAVAVGMALELVARDRHGGGQVGLTSMISTMGHVLGDIMLEYPGRPEPTWPDADQLGYHPLYRLYPAADGWIVLCAPTEEGWSRLRAALPQVAERRRDDPDLASALAEIFLTRPAQEWERDLSAEGIGCAAVTPQLGGLAAGMFQPGQIGEQLGYITTVEHPLFGEHRRSTALVRLSRGTETLGAGCLIGQHSDAILAELGYDEDQIAKLRADGVIGG
jgi:crotonobetainyl-CoA:carnitine CoA-transferase CaiB-like acyl-CoA transferase